ncbi:adenosine deaminase [Desemzia sp. RIT804]|uniref:adenosine deaminase n=1 Tax=Desemzia sp. RIT 804 TaxID=2810209 RepID=UPI00194EDF84|nr:adenosine deaminase [Desemzia sp. RIT 804]
MQKEIVHQLPKVELHCHLDGSVPMETLKKLAEKQQFDKTLLDQIVAPAKCHDLADYLKSFDITLQLLQTYEQLEESAYATAEAAALENVRYLELRFAPLLHTEAGMTLPEIIAAVSNGIRRAMEQYNIVVNLLICGMRQHPNEDNLVLLSEVMNTRENLLVGFDMAGPEPDLANDHIGPLTTFAKEKDLQITLHSGECGCAHNVVQAIHLGAERIGHGIATQMDEAAQMLCVEKGTVIELCPTSNIQTNAVENWDVYPLFNFMEKGIKCCVNTDNRTVSHTTLTKEYLLLAEHLGINYATMKTLNLNGLAGAFTTSEVKAQLSTVIAEAYAPYV